MLRSMARSGSRRCETGFMTIAAFGESHINGGYDYDILLDL